MKYCTICLLILLSWLPAWSQRSAYDPAARQPAKQGDGFVEFALKQINPQNKDYGCQIDDARKLLARHNKLVSPSAESLWLALRIERRLGERVAEQSYANQLRRRFPGSPEYQALQRGQYD